MAELAEDRPLAPRHRDHALGGQWKDHRDCHVRPDLVLIYASPTPNTLIWCASAPTTNSASDGRHRRRGRGPIRGLHPRGRPAQFPPRQDALMTRSGT
ncbi:MAG: type II toxin-antitoxin system YafQ family toxin [Rhodospirillales bacterium]|nr:type II toxin-antitoxin system YafQ family toxin [Rhodospirillales bacterium]